MIDKDQAERYGAAENNLQVVLCEFHVVKIFETQLKKFFNEKNQVEAFQFIKSIQRSANEQQLALNMKKMKKWSPPEFWIYFSAHWLCEDWLHCWIDMRRPGARRGIFNTNNSCESFFKKLLRGFLGGIGNRNPSTVLEIVESNVFLYYESLFTQDRRKSRRGKKIIYSVKSCAKDILTLVDKEQLISVDISMGKAVCQCIFFFCKGKCSHAEFAASFLEVEPTNVDTQHSDESLLSVSESSSLLSLTKSSESLLSLTSTDSLSISEEQATSLDSGDVLQNYSANISDTLSSEECESLQPFLESALLNDQTVIKFLEKRVNSTTVDYDLQPKKKRGPRKKKPISSKLVQLGIRPGPCPKVPAYQLRRSARTVKAPVALQDFYRDA